MIRYFTLTLTFIAISYVAQAQQFFPPGMVWQHCYGGSSNDKASGIKATPDGGFIIVGSTQSSDSDVTFNAGSYDIWVVKTDSIGNIQWQKTYGGSSADDGARIMLTPDGGYLIGGTSSSTDGTFINNKGLTDVVLIKTDSGGVVQWAQNYGGTNKDNLASIGMTSDNNYLIGATSFSNDGDVSFNYGSADFWILKVDTLGVIVWEKSFGGTSSDFCSGVQEINNGFMFMAGSTTSNDGDISNNHGKSDYWAAKLYSKDSIVWKNCFGGSEDDIAFAFQQNNALGYVVVGNSLSNDGDVSGHVGPYGANGTTDAWIMKLTNVGILQWQDSFGGALYETATDVFQQPDSDYIITGWSNSLLPKTAPNHGSYDNWTSKMSRTGNRNWSVSLGGTDAELCKAILQTTDSGYIMAGSTRSNDIDVSGNNGNEDMWIVRLGKQIPNAISEINLHTTAFAYPNPATDIINIRIKESIYPIVDEIAIYDSMGRLIMREPTGGQSKLIFKRNGQKAGLYSYQLFSGTRIMATEKFILQ